MSNSLNTAALEQVFLTARTFSQFTNKDVPDALIHQLYDLMKWGPTSMNCQPGHYVVLKSPEAKKRLQPCLSLGNQAKTLAAPATIIVAMDTQFYTKLPVLFPSFPDAKAMFESNAELKQSTAFRNSTLQGAYAIIAARLLGLDCGPMSGFNKDLLDKEFFPDGRYQSNFLINIGYGDNSQLHPRGPKLDFKEAVDIL